LATAPPTNSSTSANAVPEASVVASSTMPRISSVPKVANARNIAIMNDTSPTRLVMNAFLAAEAYSAFSNQNPISR
jgi:hypothetical protein